MPRNLFSLLIVGTSIVAAGRVDAHPGSGIAVDSAGNVFFQDSAARTIWQLDVHGKVTSYYDKIGGHWMALDEAGRFTRSSLSLVESITPKLGAAALIVADGGAPIAIHENNLYYGLDKSDSGKAIVGMTKISADGAQERFATGFGRSIAALGITGLAAGPDGVLYAACLTDIAKVRPDGSFSKLVESVEVKDCDRDAPTCFLRGLGVDSRGAVYAAACGCRCVIRVTSNGVVETVLKAERPWAPTGIAVHRDDIYVLEYTNANGNLRDGWRPRIRLLTKDGRVSILATISEQQQKSQPNRLAVTD